MFLPQRTGTKAELPASDQLSPLRLPSMPLGHSGIECDHTLSHLLLRNLLQKNNSIQPRCDLFTSRHGDVESDHIWPQPMGKGVPDAALQRMVPGRTMRQRGASGDVVRLDSLVLLSP